MEGGLPTQSKLGVIEKMVNTMVKDPQNRKLNRKLDRQKKARMKLYRKSLLNPSDPEPESLAEIHTLKIAELKKDRDKLREKSVKLNR